MSRRARFLSGGEMRLIFAPGCLLLLWLIPMNIFAQGADSQKKVQELLASFNKKRHRVVERRGVRAEKYLEIRSVPVAKEDVSDYSGRYVVPDQGHSIELRVGRDASVAGAGSEPSRSGDDKERRFVLKNGKIDGPLLTADKVYEDGATERFEGLFIKLTQLDTPDAEGVSFFGIGTLDRAGEVGVGRNRLFYRRQN